MKSSGIGGQAVIEGVMMKNQDKYSIAIRKPDKEIEVIEKDYVATTKKHPALNIPIVRGVVNFIDSMVIGVSTLTLSSSYYEEDEEEPGKLDALANKVFKDKLESVLMGVTILISVVMAVGLFMILPYVVSRLFSKVITSNLWLNVLEGITRMVIFLIYVVLISQMEDIKRVFMYHGAEHKSINCIESGLPLTVENVRKSTRFHKRCGTSFMIFIMIISIILFMFIQFENKLINLLLRVVLVPVIAGISYEILKLAGNSDSKFINFISAPGLWLQRLTTKEPDDSMIEVAIAAIEKVFDWEAYLAENEEASKEEEKDAFEFVDMEEIDNINSIDDIDDIFENKDEIESMNAAKAEEAPKAEEKKGNKKSSKKKKSRKNSEPKKEEVQANAENDETAAADESVTAEEDLEVAVQAISAQVAEAVKDTEKSQSATIEVEEEKEPVGKAEEAKEQEEPVAEVVEAKEQEEPVAEVVEAKEQEEPVAEVVEAKEQEEPVADEVEVKEQEESVAEEAETQKPEEAKEDKAQKKESKLAKKAKELKKAKKDKSKNKTKAVPKADAIEEIKEEPEEVAEDIEAIAKAVNAVIKETATKETAAAAENPLAPVMDDLDEEKEIVMQEFVKVEKNFKYNTRTYTKIERKGRK